MTKQTRRRFSPDYKEQSVARLSQPGDVRRMLVPRLSQENEGEIAALVEESLVQRQESEKLLEQAKARVEQLIEEAVQA